MHRSDDGRDRSGDGWPILASQDDPRQIARDFDAVLLDVNLDGEYNPETADLLLEMGVPFAFVTGYDYVVDPRHDNVPLLQKPFSSIQLRVLVEQLVGSVRSGDGAAQTA